MNLSYDQIWRDFKDQSYPGVTEHEKLMIHKKWKSLGQIVWKSTCLK